MNYQEFMPEELRARVRERMSEVLSEIEERGQTTFALPDDALLAEMMSFATGEAVADDYIAMMREDLTCDSLASRSPGWRKPPDRSALRDSEVVIIGAGMSGLYAAIQLREAGLPFVILEKNDASAAPRMRTSIPAAVSTRRTISIPTPSSLITTGRIISPSATSSGAISSASPTNSICASGFSSAPR
jgi:4-hydroxyacetophenone monooxygenase